MDRRLVDISQAGNIEALYALLEDEPHILNFIDDTPYTRTPLHLAILAQKPHFAKEIATLRPSFVIKVDSFGYSPLHLAAEKGQVDVLRVLLEMSKDHNNQKMQLQHIRGQENRTPLHFAVISGKIEVINFLLKSYPDCILDSTIRNETALHLAVKYKQLGVFLVLVEWLKLAYLVHAVPQKVPLIRAVCSPCFDDGNTTIGLEDINGLLNCKDEEGYNVLHLAMIAKQHKMIEALVSWCNNSGGEIEVNEKALTSKSFTSIDFWLQFPLYKRYSQSEALHPPLCLNMSNYKVLNTKHLTNNFSFGLDVVFAIVMLMTCLFTATYTDFHPFLVFNMVGFCLSFSLLVVASNASPCRRIMVVLLTTVLGAYAYLLFSAIASEERLYFGALFLNIAAAISMIHAKFGSILYNKKGIEEVKIPLSCHGYAEP